MQCKVLYASPKYLNSFHSLVPCHISDDIKHIIKKKIIACKPNCKDVEIVVFNLIFNHSFTWHKLNIEAADTQWAQQE